MHSSQLVCVAHTTLFFRGWNQNKTSTTSPNFFVGYAHSTVKFKQDLALYISCWTMPTNMGQASAITPMRGILLLKQKYLRSKPVNRAYALGVRSLQSINSMFLLWLNTYCTVFVKLLSFRLNRRVPFCCYSSFHVSSRHTVWVRRWSIFSQ